MERKKYKHSAYWYAYHNGWTYSEAKTYAGRYLDQHTYRPRRRKGYAEEFSSREWFAARNSGFELDSTFNPLLFCACGMVDIGTAMRTKVAKLSDPEERDRMKREFIRDLRALRRPFYYARETERRRKLAIERRKVTKRTTSAPMPEPEEILAAWNARKESREAMIRLGGMIHDLECYVDNCLKFDEYGNIVGRNRGIKGWLANILPELLPKYKTLMRYKAMAVRVRQATGTEDPTPTSALLEKTPRHEALEKILSDSEPVFSHVFAALEYMLSPDTVLLDPPKPKPGDSRKQKPCDSAKGKPGEKAKPKLLESVKRKPAETAKSKAGDSAKTDSDAPETQKPVASANAKACAFAHPVREAR